MDGEFDFFGDVKDDSQENSDIIYSGGQGNDNIRKDGDESLEAVSSEALREPSEVGGTGEPSGEDSPDSQGRDDRNDGQGLRSIRGEGDSSEGVYSDRSGESSGSVRSGTGHRNYRITSDDEQWGGQAQKCDNNLAALELLKNLEKNGRYASAEEQEILVKYTGWGGLAEIFKSDLTGAWKNRQEKLQSLLTKEEYKSARRSTINAHYTDPAVARAIWAAALRMGYSGGPTMEPAAGIGHFFGVRPESVPVVMHGIEMDTVSGRIAQHLYQDADITIAPYESIRMPKDTYNLFISNVPFADIKPYEAHNVKTPGLDGSYSLHDFYFLKSIYGTKPGGLVAFITSRYTMDKTDQSVRQKIADSADFIGAIRLPNTTFEDIANTQVVTDIIFLKKRKEGEEISELTREWIRTTPISLNKEDGSENSISINSYFISHPQMVLGTHGLTGSMYRSDEYTVEPSGDDLKKSLERAVHTLPENILSINYEIADAASYSEFVKETDFESIPWNSYYIGPDTRLYLKDETLGYGHPSELYEEPLKNRESIERIMQMVTIANSAHAAIDHHVRNQPIAEREELTRLNTLYDAFVLKYGFLNSKKNRALFGESYDGCFIASLENWDAKKKIAKKCDLFTGITIARPEYISHADTPEDALSLSLSLHGKVNITYMSSLLDKDQDSVISDLVSKEMIYLDPQTYLECGERLYLTKDAYLSGNVREKLNTAKKAASADRDLFSRNVVALENVIPVDLKPEDGIVVRLNSPVVGDHNVVEFIKDIFDTPYVRATHYVVDGKWEVTIGRYSGYVNREYGTADVNAAEIIDRILNGKPLKVFDKVKEGDDTVSIFNPEKTLLAEEKAEKIAARFQEWVWSDPVRTEEICRRYNDTYNSTVERVYVHPDRMKDPNTPVRIRNCAFPAPLRPHQADGVWRIINQKNVMLAHAVGAGKTLTMACGAMELKRLGLRSKSVIVCPDHMIGQWGKEFREAYPHAKYLIADEDNWDTKNRRTFINRIATGDWDVVLMRLNSFKQIPISPEYEMSFITHKMDEYREYLEASPNKKNRNTKAIEKRLVSYQTRLAELRDMKRDEGVLYFDQLGVDQLFIDEADVYKNLEFYTQLEGVKGLGKQQGSERAYDMAMKVEYVQNQGGGVVFGTGTPISNTLVEAYSMMRYLQPQFLKDAGLRAFDEWARTFAEPTTQLELSNTGNRYVPVTRFSKIVNVPELVSTLRQVWDVQTASNLEDNGILVPGVNLPYKKQINVAAPSTDLLKSYLEYLVEREANLGKPIAGADNVLVLLTDGRKASVDLRLIHPDLPDDPHSKLNHAVKLIYDKYDEYRQERYTSVVFFDRPCSHSNTGEVLFDAIKDMKTKLVAMGVDEKEIGDVRQCKNYAERQALFERVNLGEIRIIFGSTDTMGAGTNAQARMKAIFHIDAPYRPRDIEQQNGRGYRPGNMTGEIEIYNLVTQGSLDTGLWNLLETKARIIQLVMAGENKAERTIAEDYYASVKELSIDNPHMKEAIELDRDIKKLKTLANEHSNVVARAKRELVSFPEIMDAIKKDIKEYKEDIAMRGPELKADDFVITLKGKKYTERKLAGEEILNIFREVAAHAKLGHAPMQEVGEYSGYTVIVNTGGAVASGTVLGKLNVKAKHHMYGTEVKSGGDPVGIIRSLHYNMYNLPEQLLSFREKDLEMNIKKEPILRKEADSVFPRAEELATKTKRYNEVLKLIEEFNSTAEMAKSESSVTIPWAELSEMPREEVRQIVDEYLVEQNVLHIDSDYAQVNVISSQAVATPTLDTESNEFSESVEQHKDRYPGDLLDKKTMDTVNVIEYNPTRGSLSRVKAFFNILSKQYGLDEFPDRAYDDIFEMNDSQLVMVGIIKELQSNPDHARDIVNSGNITMVPMVLEPFVFEMCDFSDYEVTQALVSAYRSYSTPLYFFNTHVIPHMKEYINSSPYQELRDIAKYSLERYLEYVSSATIENLNAVNGSDDRDDNLDSADNRETSLESIPRSTTGDTETPVQNNDAIEKESDTFVYEDVALKAIQYLSDYSYYNHFPQAQYEALLDSLGDNVDRQIGFADYFLFLMSDDKSIAKDIIDRGNLNKVPVQYQPCVLSYAGYRDDHIVCMLCKDAIIRDMLHQTVGTDELIGAGVHQLIARAEGNEYSHFRNALEYSRRIFTDILNIVKDEVVIDGTYYSVTDDVTLFFDLLNQKTNNAVFPQAVFDNIFRKETYNEVIANIINCISSEPRLAKEIVDAGNVNRAPLVLQTHILSATGMHDEDIGKTLLKNYSGRNNPKTYIRDTIIPQLDDAFSKTDSPSLRVIIDYSLSIHIQECLGESYYHQQRIKGYTPPVSEKNTGTTQDEHSITTSAPAPRNEAYERLIENYRNEWGPNWTKLANDMIASGYGSNEELRKAAIIYYDDRIRSVDVFAQRNNGKMPRVDRASRNEDSKRLDLLLAGADVTEGALYQILDKTYNEYVGAEIIRPVHKPEDYDFQNKDRKDIADLVMPVVSTYVFSIKTTQYKQDELGVSPSQKNFEPIDGKVLTEQVKAEVPTTIVPIFNLTSGISSIEDIARACIEKYDIVLPEVVLQSKINDNIVKPGYLTPQHAWNVIQETIIDHNLQYSWHEGEGKSIWYGASSSKSIGDIEIVAINNSPSYRARIVSPDVQVAKTLGENTDMQILIEKTEAYCRNVAIVQNVLEESYTRPDIARDDMTSHVPDNGKMSVLTSSIDPRVEAILNDAFFDKDRARIDDGFIHEVIRAHVAQKDFIPDSKEKKEKIVWTLFSDIVRDTLRVNDKDNVGLTISSVQLRDWLNQHGNGYHTLIPAIDIINAKLSESLMRDKAPLSMKVTEPVVTQKKRDSGMSM